MWYDPHTASSLKGQESGCCQGNDDKTIDSMVAFFTFYDNCQEFNT